MPLPSPIGAEKKVKNEAEHAAASAMARRRHPEAQPDNVPVTEPTSSGAAGPRRITLEGGGGYADVPGGPDPARGAGGFLRDRPSQDRFAHLGERATVVRGPRGATGGNQWTLRTPGAQEAQIEDLRFRRELQARHSAEDAAISELDARAAAASAAMSRSRELEADPFAPEKAQVAAVVGEQQAKAQPALRGQEFAAEAVMRFQQFKSQVMQDPNISPEEKQRMISEAENETWMAIIAAQPRARRPQPTFGGLMPPLGEEET
jgi:hypothetical protein